MTDICVERYKPALLSNHHFNALTNILPQSCPSAYNHHNPTIALLSDRSLTRASEPRPTTHGLPMVPFLTRGGFSKSTAILWNLPASLSISWPPAPPAAPAAPVAAALAPAGAAEAEGAAAAAWALWDRGGRWLHAGRMRAGTDYIRTAQEIQELNRYSVRSEGRWIEE